ncbi:hypothetical protein G5C51_06970 [Streptomyces sp. A7024]|uniref:Uncharacterized protein n=1 Tax=Streptomyces coryli TaxID=1128680 RepID=A0A6G4TUF0_9ACTN|nr:hypothetical protein [Streptomyces coryli]NGN63649.1 hypothetical protein [Streptomyces coryli]
MHSYGRLQVRTDDLSPARWLIRSRTEDGFGTVAGVSAPGFDAYARVLHPAALDERPVPWAEVAAAYGKPLTALSNWHELIGMGRDYVNAQQYGLPGVWDEHPVEGPTPPALARQLMPVLARHTAAADRCWFGVWHGYGTWDFTGVPVFKTPGRDEVLLSGPLADADSPEALHASGWVELPDLWWPDDRAWCLGGDVDLVSTYIGGTEALIADLLETRGLEAFKVCADDRVG